MKRVEPAEGHPQEGLLHGRQEGGLEPQSPGFWAPGAGFMEDNFPWMGWKAGMVLGHWGVSVNTNKDSLTCLLLTSCCANML